MSWVQEDAWCCTLQTPFVQSDVKRPLLSVGNLTQSGAEVKFGSKGPWIDLHTDTGVQRVPVRVKNKTFGLSIQKTDAWIIPQASDPTPPADEDIGRAEAPNSPPQEAAAARGQGMRLEREARDLAAAWQSSRHLGQPLGEGRLLSGSNVELRNMLKALGAPGVGHEGSAVASTRVRRGKTRAPET